MKILYCRSRIRGTSRSVTYTWILITDLDEYIRNRGDRPPSAFSQSTRPGSAAKMTEPSMRDTFYSSIGGEGGTEVGEKRIVESFKLSNILELGEKERAIVSQIKEIMSDECDRLQADIDEVQA